MDSNRRLWIWILLANRESEVHSGRSFVDGVVFEEDHNYLQEGQVGQESHGNQTRVSQGI